MSIKLEINKEAMCEVLIAAIRHNVLTKSSLYFLGRLFEYLEEGKAEVLATGEIRINKEQYKSDIFDSRDHPDHAARSALRVLADAGIVERLSSEAFSAHSSNLSSTDFRLMEGLFRVVAE